MSALLRIYDDVTSNKYVSLGITAASTAFMAYKITFYIDYMYSNAPLTFAISTCVGVAFALLSNSYLAHNKSVKNENERNGVYATLALIVAVIQPETNHIYEFIFRHNIARILRSNGYEFCSMVFLNGFGIGFLATNLTLQLMEKSNKN